MVIVGSVVTSIEALTNERDKANEVVIELVDILKAALIDRLMVDHDTETANNILAGHIALPAGYPEWVSAAVARLSCQTR